VSSTLNWAERGLSLTQTTDLPLTDKVDFTITAAPTDAVNLRLRKPDWTSTCEMAVAVNGQSITPVEENGFVSVSRVWQANDTVELAFPLFVQSSRLPDNQNSVAFTYGPLVLSAGLGTASMTTTGHMATIMATKPDGLQDTIAINGSTTINDWLANIQDNLVKTEGTLEFNLKNTDSDGKLVFIPHYSRYQDRYGIYFELSGTSGGAATTNLVCPTVTVGTGEPGGAGGASGVGGSTNGGTAGAMGEGGASGTITVAGGGGSTSGGTSGTVGGAAQAGASGAQGSGGVTSVTGGSSNGGSASLSGGATTAGNGVGGGAGAAGGSVDATADDSQPDSGCSCDLAKTNSTQGWALGLLFGLGLMARRRNGWHRRA